MAAAMAASCSVPTTIRPPGAGAVPSTVSACGPALLNRSATRITGLESVTNVLGIACAALAGCTML
jgi:hypothetical protein